MAIQIDNAQTSSKVGSVTPFTSHSFSYTISDLPNRKLAIMFMAENTNGQDVHATNVTYNGVAFTKRTAAAASYGGSTKHQTDIWVLDEASLPTAGSYTVALTFAGQINQELNISILTLYNVIQAAGVSGGSAGASQNNGTTTSLSIYYTTNRNKVWILQAYGLGGNNPVTAASGQTTIADFSAYGFAHLTTFYKEITSPESGSLNGTYSSNTGTTSCGATFAPTVDITGAIL